LNKNNGFLSSGKKKKEEVVQNLVQKVLHAELGLCLAIARQTRASAAPILLPPNTFGAG
jgi:hypothetical protein